MRSQCLISIGVLMFLSTPGHAEDQPVSIIAEGEQYALFGDPDGALKLSTAEVPLPPFDEAVPIGRPVYYWDFGHLNGTDHGDGTAIIATDVEGTYHVSVSCRQEYDDGQGGIISAQTEPSE